MDVRHQAGIPDIRLRSTDGRLWMTRAADLDLNKCCSEAALTRPARQVHQAVLAVFAESGRPPAGDELTRMARQHGADPDTVLAELAKRDIVVFDGDGEIRAAYPFSPKPTAIRVTWEGGPLTYAMCAIDALGVSAMLGRPVTITAAEPGTGELITVDVDGENARWSPGGAVVFAGAADDECCPSADRTCGYINFFTSTRAARKWARNNPAISGKVVRQAWALGQGVAEFGTFMRAGEAATPPYATATGSSRSGCR
jgi:hypothetical protein